MIEVTKMTIRATVAVGEAVVAVRALKMKTKATKRRTIEVIIIFN